MKKISIIIALILAIIASLVLLPQEVQADTITWVGGDGYWSEPTNWSSGTVPDSIDNIVIDGDSGITSSVILDTHFILEGSLSIKSDDNLLIEPGVSLSSNLGIIYLTGTVVNDGGFSNNGTIENAGSLINNGTIENGGTIENYETSTIENHGTIDNDSIGAINNDGIITNWVNIRNQGEISNNGYINFFYGEILNQGLITNNGTIDNSEVINNYYFINNYGTINNTVWGTINNEHDINNYDIFNNEGTINNGGPFYNHCGAIFNNTGFVYGAVVDMCNTNPIADDDYYVTSTGLTLNVDAPGVLLNDIDPDGDDLVAKYPTDPANGIVSVNPDGSFSYTPNLGFIGEDSFTYMAIDGRGGYDTATVTITVNGGGSDDLLLRIEALEATVLILETENDSLQQQLDSLQEELLNHTHGYLTGKGKGHNNTEAMTGTAEILLEP
jgi:hypothetical protein